MSRTRRWGLTTSFNLACAWAAACSGAGEHHSGNSTPQGPQTQRDAATAPSSPTVCRTAGTEASQVVILGESFVALTHAIPTMLSAHAREAGTIDNADSYRDFSVPGTELATGALAAQYQRAKSAGPVKVVLLSGGATDLILGRRCETGFDARCKEISDAVAALFAELQADGVQDVLYFFYPDPGGIGERFKPAMNTLRPELQKLCQTTSLVHCQWLDPRATWQGHPEYSVDGLYPTTAGSQAIADAIWQSMLDHCIGQ